MSRPAEGRARGSADPAALTLNELVLADPAALDVLAGWGLDTCCGGSLALGEACRRHGLEVEEVLASLRPCGGDEAASV